MNNVTHFIEVCATPRGEMWQHSYPINIDYLDECLNRTKKLKHIKTVAVWLIRPKLSVVQAFYDNELLTTIVE